MANNYFDRYDKRYEIADKKSNHTTGSRVKRNFTGEFIACTTFMAMPRVKAVGGFTTDKDKDGKLIVVGKNTGERIKFTDVARSYRKDCKHAFQKVIETYADGRSYTIWMLMNAIIPSKR